MFSLMYEAAKYVVSSFKSKELDIDEIIARFNDEFGENSTSEDTKDDSETILSGCFYRTGIVTMCTSEYLFIDDVYHCSLLNCPSQTIEVGDAVSYLAYQKTPKDEIRVRKVVAILNNAWDNICENASSAQNQLMKKIIVAKVLKREARNVFLEPMNIVIDLDSIDSTFVPYVGDWMRIHCFVELDEDSPDLGGNILEVERIQPLRSNLKVGRVTKYDSEKGSGVVERDTVFSKVACKPGYLPTVGDKVACDAIESDQGAFTWRCLSVVPLSRIADKSEQNHPEIDAKQQEDYAVLLENKNGIKIDNDLSFTLEVGEEKTLEVTLKNSRNFSQIFHRGIFISKKSQSQLSVSTANFDSMMTLGPKEEIKFLFKCQAKFVGLTEELVIFSFKGFKIGRQFRITVNPKNLMGTPEVVPGSNKVFLARQDNDEQENFVPGVRYRPPPRFITVRDQFFKIPQRLWNDILCIVNRNKSQTEAEVMLCQTMPCLKENLMIENYTIRFHALLYLEEISLTIDLQKYDLASASMRHVSKFLVLKVPGLVERKPSLIVGDRAIVSFQWDTSQGHKKYEGWIHKIASTEIFLKFNQYFHETYNGEDCQVTFKSNYSGIRKFHNAVDLAVAHLTRKILFPVHVAEKEAQIIIEEIEENNTTEEAEMNFKEDEKMKINAKSNKRKDMFTELIDFVDENLKNDLNRESMKKRSQEILQESVLKRRKLKWFNKSLNKYQKEAVRNILYGVARPLPYVIFGPPGTGKTITLCEAILQILSTLPESRLLVATPSNSSANLIAERLVESGALQPGDLVRLIAHHCLTDDSIPEKLLPYCATGSLAAEHTVKNRRNNNWQDPSGVKVNCTTSVLGRHRITIGTCGAVGLLYNMGFPRGHFTHILVDEAGQATEPEIMIPLTFVHADHGQIILAGDPMQLGPVINSLYSSSLGLSESFLVRLLQQFPYQRDPEGFENGYDPRLVTKLIINYRSLPEILELPSKLFYDADLMPNVDPMNSLEAKILESLQDALPVRKSGTTPAIVFHGVNGENRQDQDSPSWCNPAEATQIYLYLLKLYSCGLTENDIGIITPYQKQVKIIKDLLVETNVLLPKVGSVEAFQGQERMVIIVSCVRSSQNHVKQDCKHALGFVASPMRLNVAITRARALLIILGNPTLLGQDPYWREVLKYCIDRENYTGCNYSVMLNTKNEM